MFDVDACRHAISQWYAHHGRDLPWRRRDCSAWGVMVSEFMLQQTPVSRVLGPWQQWLDRWPTPSALAAEPLGEALRAWGRLGYPRRAQRLHAAATVISAEFDDVVPTAYDQLRRLPGVGDYTAAAIASFAYGQRCLVIDTNVRRVIARLIGPGLQSATLTAAERVAAEEFVPEDPAEAATWAAASMELGALVCTAKSPRCEDCPVAELCTWRALGYPAEVVGRGQTYEGTDRQCRGKLLAALQATSGGLATDQLLTACDDPTQAQRCLASLLVDGLVVDADDVIALP